MSNAPEHDPVTAIRRQLDRISTFAREIERLPDGQQHLADLKRLLTHPQIERIISSAEEHHIARVREAGRHYLNAFQRVIAAENLQPVISVELADPSEPGEVCRLLISDRGAPPLDGGRATRRDRVHWQVDLESRVHDLILAEHPNLLGCIIMDIKMVD